MCSHLHAVTYSLHYAVVYLWRALVIVPSNFILGKAPVICQHGTIAQTGDVRAHPWPCSLFPFFQPLLLTAQVQKQSELVNEPSANWGWKILYQSHWGGTAKRKMQSHEFKKTEREGGLCGNDSKPEQLLCQKIVLVNGTAPILTSAGNLSWIKTWPCVEQTLLFFKCSGFSNC